MRAAFAAAARELDVQRLRQAHDAPLGGGVGRELGSGGDAGQGGRVDHRRGPSLREHARHERLDPVGDAEQVHVDDALPVLDGRVLEVAAEADAGVVVEDVDVPVGGEDRLGQRLHGRGVGHVERVRRGAAAG